MRVIVGALVVTVGLSFAAPAALAAFPGANGLLAVQPVSGGGILLVNSNGGVVRRICTVNTRCGTPRQPRWSPDGRAIVSAGPRITIVYTDGSCMDCQFGAAANPVFKPGGTVISFIQGHRQVTLDGIDGVREPSPPLGSATDAVWAADGQVAVVRAGWLWVGHPGKLRRVVPGSAPSWSPGGDRLAAAQRGWVVIMRLRDHDVRRLARGSAPAFSPDGRWIAFVAPGHRLMIVAASGGRPRAVGHLEALSVDWQPMPRGPNPGCAAPSGSTVIASAPDAIVTQDGVAQPPFGFTFAPAVAYMGCLPADGRERLLERITGNNVDNASWVKSAVLAAPYAALVEHSEDEHYGGSGEAVQVFDLRTGELRKNLGGEAAGCPGYPGAACTTLDDIVLGRDGVSAAHWHAVTNGPIATELEHVACAPGSSLCVAVDGELGDILTSSDPAAGWQSWSVGKLFAGPVPSAIACPSVSLCVGAHTDVYTTLDPAAGAPSWTATALPEAKGNAQGISCPTVSLCVVTREDGSIATSADPTGGNQAWTTARVDPTDGLAGVGLAGVVCSIAPRCFVTNSNGSGRVFVSSHPTDGAGAWTVSPRTPTFDSGACPTRSLCVTVNGSDVNVKGSEIATSTDPAGATWTRRSVADYLKSISCPSAALCVAVGSTPYDEGALDVSTDPAAGSWTHVTADKGGEGLLWVSCASTSLCVATDHIGNVLVSTNPAGGASAWTLIQLEAGPCGGAGPCSNEQIQASDKFGFHAFDTSATPGSGPFLTGLTLNGDTLSWSHAGTPEMVTLTPP